MRLRVHGVEGVGRGSLGPGVRADPATSIVQQICHTDEADMSGAGMIEA
jgi:hypothetical protein